MWASRDGRVCGTIVGSVAAHFAFSRAITRRAESGSIAAVGREAAWWLEHLRRGEKPQRSIRALSAPVRWTRLLSLRPFPARIEDELFDVTDGYRPLIAIGNPSKSGEQLGGMAY